ncbi:DUF485 domain-containing protein [Pseudonocardia sp. K10HN5]|uniref:DUF485 domain-containing protein n=2 Tax=Pseudonocardia acidicola TaxID=2724939 RepID=A0ABX1SK07_9PSEU|nr:DUF485 domain-containing protein [Pseudonocardia acidicola]
MFGTVDEDSAGPDFVAIQNSPEFVRLRADLRRFIFPVTGLFLVWYLVFVILSAYAHDMMSRPVIGVINVGMILGLLQFVSTLLIVWAYGRFARTRIDPQAREIRHRAEGN